MDNKFKIKQLSKEYFVTLDGKPVFPGVNDEPGTFENDLLPIYRLLVHMFGVRVKLVCVTTFDEDLEKDGEKPE